MKKTKRLLSLILAGTILTSTAVFTANAQTSAPEYAIDFVYDVDSEIATATISVEGGTYGVGHFGFTYNVEALTLINKDGNEFDVNSDKMADVIIGYSDADEYEVITTEETNLIENLIDTATGDVLFGWYVTDRFEEGVDKGFINSADEKKIIATVNFGLTSDIAESDNPAAALKQIIEDENNSLISVFDGDIDGLKGWNDIYVIGDQKVNKYVSDADDILISERISPEINDLEITTKPKEITVSWTVDEEDVEKVGYYEVVITDQSGTVIATERIYPSGSETEFNLTFNNGIETNKKYNVSVTTVTNSGNSDSSVSDTAITRPNSPVIVDPGIGGVSSSSGGMTTTYTVTFNAGEGVIPDGQKFKYTVALNGYVSGSPAVIAPDGKVFAGWSVDGVTLISVEVYKITKNVTFRAIYVDKTDDMHSPFIVGYPGGEVRADAPLTRAEAATIIARASANFDSTKIYTANFSDVPAGHWAANYIAFVYENDIVTGYDDNTFHPDSNITRAEFATIMQRYLDIELNEDASFIDVGKDHWAVSYIGACKVAGLINGYENGEFRPSNEITRAEAVKILNRAADRIPNSTAIGAYINEKGIPFADLDFNKWYFYEIMEAAFPHLVSYYH